MNILFRLYYEFFKTGLFSVGGGLATLPFLNEMADNTGWFTRSDVADLLAVSESTPGPIGVNMATYAGFTTAGIPGALAATLGLATPSIIIIFIIATFLKKFAENKFVKRAFYGLRPASIAMISAAGINVAFIALLNAHNNSVGSFTDAVSIIKFPAIILAVAIYIGQKKLKWHPAVFIAIAAVVGIVLKF